MKWRRFGIFRSPTTRSATSRAFTTWCDGVAGLPNLRALRLLDNRGLSNLEALRAGQPPLHDLYIDTCRRINDLEPLRSQRELTGLALINGGRVPTLAPLADLPRLRELWFYESTVVEDGDMSVLLRMPSLERTSFAPRRHYTHRSADVERELQRRHPEASKPPEAMPWWARGT